MSQRSCVSVLSCNVADELSAQTQTPLPPSTRIGTALDGNGIYGKYVSHGQTPTDLDVCGGRTGVTPDSAGQTVYYYMAQETAPFTVGCFGPVSSVQECKALYPNDCDNGDTITVTTAEGSRSYDPDCPCWEPNRASSGAPAASTQCNANMYYDATASACADCPANSGAPAASTSESACACNMGFSGDPCVHCVAGKYKSAQGSDPCTDCGQGKYSDTVGAVSEATCSDCGAGKYSPAVGATGDVTCLACPSGKYSGVVGAASSATCSDCGVGKYSSAVGQTAESTCSTCPANSDAPVASSAAADCRCNAGYTGPGGGTCTACPAGATSVSGASSTDDCVCVPGFVGGGSACDPCPAGTYKAMEGSIPCTGKLSKSYSLCACESKVHVH